MLVFFCFEVVFCHIVEQNPRCFSFPKKTKIINFNHKVMCLGYGWCYKNTNESFVEIERQGGGERRRDKLPVRFRKRMSCLDLCLVVSCQKFSLDSGKGNRSEDVCYTLDKKAASPCLGLLGNPHKVSPWGRNSSLLSLGEQQVQEVQRYPMNICVHTTLKLWNQTL